MKNVARKPVWLMMAAWACQCQQLEAFDAWMTAQWAFSSFIWKSRSLDDIHTSTKQLNNLFIEQFCVLDKYKIAGTPDRIVEYKGERFIADIKTGRIDHPNNIAIQLAIYANGNPYDIATGRRGTWGDVNKDKAIIIHLPAGTGLCKLVWIDIAEGWKGVQFAMKVRQWRDKKGLATPFEEQETISG